MTTSMFIVLVIILFFLWKAGKWLIKEDEKMDTVEAEKLVKFYEKKLAEQEILSAIDTKKFKKAKALIEKIKAETK